jgi:hypothetical protein
VLRDLMTREDVKWNVRRLNKEGDAKHKHARALEAWDEARPDPADREEAA